MSNSPFVSVVVPTLNREADLREALQSLCAQDYSNFEIIVVDNASTDDIDGMLRDLETREPRLRHVLEPVRGVGPAHNRGCQEARGELIAFLDNDEIAPPYWLSTLVAAQRETGAGAVGGPYEPLWLAPPPAWLANSRAMQETLSFMDFGTQRRQVEWVLGGNAMYTRQALADANYFGGWHSYTNERSLVGGGDIVVGERVRRAGHEIWFEPAAVVKHKVPPSRMRLCYVLRRAFWAGYTDVAIGREWKLGNKAGKALRRGPDAIALGLAILPGTLYGRLMVKLGRLKPVQAGD